MPENEVHSIEDYREQIARVRNAFSVMQAMVNAKIDTALTDLDKLQNEAKEHGKS